MTFRFANDSLGWQAMTESSTTQKHSLGRIAQGSDTSLGAGEFIYLKGVASTVVGSVVRYDDSFQTALDTAALNTPWPVAVAMSANGAAAFGWYQISGIATMLKANTVSFAKGAALGVATGKAIAAATGQILNSALVAVVASAKSDVTSVKVMINRPHEPSDLS